jgi:Methionine synthase II (cobalamin-independent)
MVIQTTMTGSYYRNGKVLEALSKSITGELPEDKLNLAYEAEKQVVLDQLHPNGNSIGLDWVSNGEQRKSGYTLYLPNRFSGFSLTEKLPQSFSQSFVNELLEASPQMAATLGESPAFNLPRIDDRLAYNGEKKAKAEALDAKKIKDETGAKRIFIPSASPGVITIFYPRTEVYHDHEDYVLSLSKELRKEYEAILSVDGVDLQIDAPDLAMAASLGVNWGVDFFKALPLHVQAINDAVKGLPADRIRVHYCYGNYAAAHLTDPVFDRVLEQLTQLKVGTLVGEMANGRHQGDPLILRKYAKEHGWPNLKYAVGVIDVKSPFVETPETVALRLENVASIDQIGPENVLGGTDCGFETFENFGNVARSIAEKKLQSLVKGAELASDHL